MLSQTSPKSPNSKVSRIIHFPTLKNENGNMKKNDCRAKSGGRKPLKDVSNSTKSSITPLKISPKKEKQNHPDDGDALDRLLLVQSDISSLVHQIDELVVQAFEVHSTCKQGREEIESFTNLLSDIQSSLKPWVPRFQKALSSSSTESANQFEKSLACKSGSTVLENNNAVVGSPSPTKFTSLVSPSPLVSWRANCPDERGRQLFLLTPLPSSKFTSNRHESSKSFLGRINSNYTGGMTFSITDDINEDVLEGVSVKATPCKSLITPSNFSKNGNSMFVMTPCSKRSPPKSCVLLEPISEFSPDEKNQYRKSTPFPVGIHHSDDSDSSTSSSQASGNLALKYPELIGIQQAYKTGVQKEKVEESFDWLMSPPKTCVLMEPSEAGAFNQPSYDNEGIACSSFALSESTPAMKEPQSIMRTGKRPGENTLKKELWTKFEQATIKPSHKRIPALDNDHKDFLDRLNEVSYQQTSSMKDFL